MRFVANLRNETIDAFGLHDIQPRAYLLSSHRVTPATLESAARVRALGLPLFADNGSKVLIDETIDTFDADAAPIRGEVREIRRAVGRTPRGRDIPDDLRARAKALADAVIDHATGLSKAVDAQALLDLQLSMDPTDLIAQEDFATACLLGLGLERRITGYSIGRFDTRNRRSLKLWRRVSDDPRCAGLAVHAVLSAVDFNTARSAGRLAGEVGVAFAALGIAGLNKDGSATDVFVIGTASHSLERPAPRRYVRLTQIMRGFDVGFAECGTALRSFHCLGLGSTAMLPIPAAGLSGEIALTTDATSPIHDAIRDQVFYERDDFGARVSTSAIANRTVEGGGWDFASPFEQQFLEDFGHDAQAARLWWTDNGQPRILREHLRTEAVLNEALPLLGEMEDAVRRRGERARVAANHWTIGEVAADLPDGSTRPAAARSAMETIAQRPSATIQRGIGAARRVLETTGSF